LIAGNALTPWKRAPAVVPVHSRLRRNERGLGPKR